MSASRAGRLYEHHALDPGVLTAARQMYEKAGFSLTSSEKRKSFGQDVVSEYWDLKL